MEAAARMWMFHMLKSLYDTGGRTIDGVPGIVSAQRGNLAEQWQDELYQRFQLPFEILTNDKLESARTGNWFAENPMAICRTRSCVVSMRALKWPLACCNKSYRSPDCRDL